MEWQWQKQKQSMDFPVSSPLPAKPLDNCTISWTGRAEMKTGHNIQWHLIPQLQHKRQKKRPPNPHT